MVEGARLESVCRGNSTVGSNPTLSATMLGILRSRPNVPPADPSVLAKVLPSGAQIGQSSDPNRRILRGGGRGVLRPAVVAGRRQVSAVRWCRSRRLA